MVAAAFTGMAWGVQAGLAVPDPSKVEAVVPPEQPIAGLRPAPISTQLGAGLGGAGGGGAVVHR